MARKRTPTINGLQIPTWARKDPTTWAELQRRSISGAKQLNKVLQPHAKRLGRSTLPPAARYGKYDHQDKWIAGEWYGRDNGGSRKTTKAKYLNMRREKGS